MTRHGGTVVTLVEEVGATHPCGHSEASGGVEEVVLPFDGSSC